MKRKGISVSRAIGTAAIVLLALLGIAPAQAQAPEKTPDPAAFARGAKSWAQHCARCHEMRDPRELRDDQLKPVITHMRIRAGLTGAQARDIFIFLQGSN